jgi:hypothetical protein
MHFEGREFTVQAAQRPIHAFDMQLPAGHT